MCDFPCCRVVNNEQAPDFLAWVQDRIEGVRTKTGGGHRTLREGERLLVQAADGTKHIITSQQVESFTAAA